ncbi:hypothetical protein GCM10010211_66820 [Streptomyces albospinus]|uniref:Uncharacterized protein n=1 Tax=Streptomyces albospinus TaxID=285515 RepID=A0ABQ2VLR6_9ACTN|nr:hypothetical protein GCM10010211_66820 [Streptomyces albospinus]
MGVRVSGLLRAVDRPHPPSLVFSTRNGRGRAGGAGCPDVKRSSPDTQPRRTVTAPQQPRAAAPPAAGATANNHHGGKADNVGRRKAQRSRNGEQPPRRDSRQRAKPSQAQRTGPQKACVTA